MHASRLKTPLSRKSRYLGLSFALTNYNELILCKRYITSIVHYLCSYNIPLVADIHFAPSIALRVAECFEKIRVNPGNYGNFYTNLSYP